MALKPQTFSVLGPLGQAMARTLAARGWELRADGMLVSPPMPRLAAEAFFRYAAQRVWHGRGCPSLPQADGVS